MSKINTRATINANIKQNGNQEITGQILNSVLNTMVDDYAEQEKLTELESLIPNDASSANKLLPTSELFDISSNRFDTSAMTPNKYINVDGSETTSTNFSVTDYIPVTEGETIYFRSLRSEEQGFMAFDERFLCAYNSSKQPLSDKGGTFVGGLYVVPSGVFFIRASISNTYLASWTKFYIGTIEVDSTNYTPYGEAFKISLIQSALDTKASIGDLNSLTENVDKHFSRVEEIPGKNRFDGVLIPGYVSDTGVVNTTSTTQHRTNKIPCKGGETICLSYSNNGVRTQGTFRFTCFYDVNDNVIPGSAFPSYAIVPDGAVAVILSFSNTINDEICLSNTDLGDLTYYSDDKLYDFSNSCDKILDILNGDGGMYEEATPTFGLLNAIERAYANGKKKVVAYPGTYDLIAEYKAKYGNSYFDNYQNYATSNPNDRGLWLQDIEVVFKFGAKVECLYEGNNQNVIDNFSAFACGNNVTIDGLVLESKNLRYGIHPDFNSTSNVTTMVLRNCDLNSYRDNDSTNKAIGAGLGIHVDWLFENCIFRTKYDGYAVRIHNNVSVDAYSKVQFIGCYFGDKGSVIMNSYSTSTHLSPCIMHGNSWKVAPTLGKETSDSNVNIQMLMYNNEQR